MTCYSIKLSNGAHAIICTPRQRVRHCRSCGRRADLLCDYPKGTGTCDAPICARCAHEIGEDRHLCPEHRKLWAEQQRQGSLAL